MLTVSDGLSEHVKVTVDVNFSRTPVQSKHNVSYRPICKIDIDAFKADILKPDLIRDSMDTCLTCVNNTVILSRLYLINTTR